MRHFLQKREWLFVFFIFGRNAYNKSDFSVTNNPNNSYDIWDLV